MNDSYHSTSAQAVGSWVVIFKSHLKTDDPDYHETAQLMLKRVQAIDGFLWVDSMRNPEGYGITLSYWKHVDAIKAFKADLDHQNAQHRGRAHWYSHYCIEIAEIKRSYSN
jgi:heme-degrading monooxygenase HmoA